METHNHITLKERGNDRIGSRVQNKNQKSRVIKRQAEKERAKYESGTTFVGK